MASRRVAAAAWTKYLVGPGKLCPSLPFQQRPHSKITVPHSELDQFRAPPQRYHLFKHMHYQPSSFAANLHNEVEALKARVLKQTPVVDRVEMSRFVGWVQTNFKTLFPNFRKRPRASMDSYLENSNASPGVKRTIREAYDRLRATGYNTSTRFTMDELYLFTKRKSFIKVENDLYQSPGGDLRKAPRLIQGATPEFISFLGPMFMSIQAEIKRVWGSKFCVWFTSGADSRALADYITESQTMKWFENDVSAFDASICEELCKLEVWLAKRMGANSACLQLMRANIKTHGVTSKGVKYRCLGTRKSGDPYTSCFNSVLNGLMHLYAIHRGGVQTESLHRHVRMLVQGDDNLMRHSPQLTPMWSVLLRLGFKCENLYRKGPLQAEFCSSRLYPVRGGYNFGPKLGRLINKLLCFNNPPVHVHPNSVARGVALGLASVATYVPLVDLFVARILQLTSGYEAFYMPGGEWNMRYRAQGPVPETKCMVDDVYGLRTTGHNMIKDRVKTLEFGDNLDFIVLQMLYDRDTAGQPIIFC